MARCILAALLAVALAPQPSASAFPPDRQCVPTSYNTTAGRRPGMLNVHIVPHTHDDAGWLKTVDQYYFGSAQGHQVAGVQFILDAVIAALQANPDRTFIYGEVAFFARWWAEQGEPTRAVVRDLVSSGRLSFVNGGWVQHDEAAAFWEDMVDQTGRGHAWLAATFGPAALPTIGWQIDPFGHSATQAGLLTGGLGFDALFFGRADYQDMQVRAAAKELEHVWRGEPSYGAAADVFTSNFKSGNYGPLPGFNFDWGQPDDPIIDNVCAFDGWNVATKVDDFVRGARDLAASTAVAGETGGSPPTIDVIVPQGSDFQYAAADVAFKSLDKLIHHVNADGRVNAFYSTPARYVAARHAAGPQAWPLKTDDFFPYADCPTCVWSGYFTSRPALKRNIRLAGAELAAARQLAAAAAVGGGGAASAAWAAPLDALAEAAALGQHHDAVAGTSKQHVACDYAARLEAGRAGLRGLVGRAMLAQAGGGEGAAAPRPRPRPPHPDPSPHAVQWCPAVNASVCGPTAAASAARAPFAVLVYNSLARARGAGVRLPVTPPANGESWRVTGPDGQVVPAQIQRVSPGAARAAASLVAAGGAAAGDAPGAELVFVAPALPPLGTAAFVVSPAEAGEAGTAVLAGVVGRWGGGAKVEAAGPGLLPLRPTGAGRSAAAAATLHLHPGTGAPAALTTADAGAEPRDMALTLSMAWYNASDGGPAAHAAPGTPDGERGSPSGAYIFRPHSRHELEMDDGPDQTTALAGPVTAEARLGFGPWAAATVRTWAGLAPEDGGLEVEWTAGPLPSDDGLGREVVVSYATDMDTRGALATDSNGRRLLTRLRDSRPTWDWNATAPVAGNYYPITSGAVLEEVDGGRGDAPRGLGLVTDRAQGAASLVDGGVEVMVHRRLTRDDGRGVGEPLNETACGCVGCGCGGLVVSGTHGLVAGLAGPGLTAAWRAAAQAASRPVLLGVVTGQEAVARLAQQQQRRRRQQRQRSSPPPQPASLPPNLHLVTLAPAGEGIGGPGGGDGRGAAATARLLVRVAHTFAAGEHPALSAPVTVDLHALLPGGARADAVVELGLAGARPLADAPPRLAWRVGRPMGGEEGKDAAAATVAAALRQQQAAVCEEGCAAGPLEVELGPMQVRTFLVTVAPQAREEEAGTASA